MPWDMKHQLWLDTGYYKNIGHQDSIYYLLKTKFKALQFSYDNDPHQYNTKRGHFTMQFLQMKSQDKEVNHIS